MPDQHAYLSASKSHRWGTCPASAVLAEYYPNRGSAAADLGRELHKIAEKCLRENTDAPSTASDMVQPYLNYLRSLPDGWLWVENTVYYGKFLGVPDDIAFGTSDAIHLSRDGKTLRVIDYKSGGMAVDPAENTQESLYAVGALDFLDTFGHDLDKIEEVQLVIVQPRLGEEPRVWETDIPGVTMVVNKLVQPAQEAVRLRGTPEDLLPPEAFHPEEDACRYCPAAANCRALKKLTESFKPPALPAVKASDFAPVVPKINRLPEYYAAVPLLRLWCDAVEEAMYAATERGEKTGYKLVEGRAGNRRYDNPESIEKLLRAAGLPTSLTHAAPSLLSPAQLEKALKKEHPDVLAEVAAKMVRAPGKPTLVPLSDPRPAFIEDRAGKHVETFAKLKP